MSKDRSTRTDGSVARPRPFIDGYDPILLAILLAAALLRLQLAHSTPLFWDEQETHIPLAESISFSLDEPNLPIRGRNHAALVGYVVHLSRKLFGTSLLGTRALHVLIAVATIAIVSVMARQSYGRLASLWTAALLSFNEYGLRIGSLATSHGPHLFFIAAAFYAFNRFLHTNRPRYLYGAAAATAMAFLCKEHSVLMLPVFMICLLHRLGRKSLASVHPWAALGVFVLLILPDVIWNVRAEGIGAQAGYMDHLGRIGGIGLNPYPIAFYARSVIDWLYAQFASTPFFDPIVEYESVNLLLGLLLLGGVGSHFLRSGGRTKRTASFALTMFTLIFVFFSVIKPGVSKDLDPASWAWVDMTLLPAALLAGARLASMPRQWVALPAATAVVGMVLAVIRLQPWTLA